MKVIVGLGNPGPEYAQTRHNVGFQVLLELAQRFQAPQSKHKFEAEVTEIFTASTKILLVAPQTYMNASGRSVKKLVSFYQLPLEELMIVCDDLNLELGRIRFRATGSAGGQKGLKNIIDQLGTEKFSRLRIGIGRPPERVDSKDFVLHRFRKSEQETVNQAVLNAADGLELWWEQNLETAMNQFNRTSQM